MKQQCSYCKKRGHRIDRCKNPSIKKLIGEAEEVVTISVALYSYWNHNEERSFKDYIKSWLNERTEPQIYLLCKHFNILRIFNKDQTSKKLKINAISIKMHLAWSSDAIQKIRMFTEEKLNKWYEHICGNFYADPQWINYGLDLICYPPHRPAIDVLKTQEKGETDDCPICYSTSYEQIKTNCNHSFCTPCVIEYMIHETKDKNTIGCPLCRTKIDKFITSNDNIYNILITRYCREIPLEQAQPPLEPLLQETPLKNGIKWVIGLIMFISGLTIYLKVLFIVYDVAVEIYNRK
jgi:hypothetical protein